jgi:2-dehydro-3-deoxygluconokinase
MADEPLQVKAKKDCRWDVVSLGEVMLRFDPGERRLTQARQFAVWEGGGEYNVARGLSRCFRQRAAVVTALVDNPIGRLLEGMMLEGGVDVSHLLWREDDGLGREARNGVYYLERGFGVRSALGCMDRGHTAVSQLQPGDVDWEMIFGDEGVRWFHTGGIFCALSESTAAVAAEAMKAARRHGTVVSFDCNYRPSLWKSRGGRQGAAAVNWALAPYVDVLFGHEGDLALELNEASAGPPWHDAASFAAMAERVREAHPTLRVIAAPVREAMMANRNRWTGVASGGLGSEDCTCYEGPVRELEILDRVGGGDSFAAGVIYGLLGDKGMEWALQCGLAHGALAMTTPGDGSYATLAEVERLMDGGSAEVQR